MAKESIKIDEQLTALVLRPRAPQSTQEEIAVQPKTAAPRDLREALEATHAPRKEAQ